MKVILISGKARHGKDTLATYLQQYLERNEERVLIAHYADLVKYVCKTFFHWDGVKDELGRHMLQYVGTDVMRSYDPDFWVRFLSEILTCFSDKWDYVIIPDTRFRNEIDGMRKQFETVHIRIVNPNAESDLSSDQMAHPSETELDDVKPDVWLYNRGTLEDLRESAETAWPIINKLFKENTV